MRIPETAHDLCILKHRDKDPLGGGALVEFVSMEGVELYVYENYPVGEQTI